MKEWTSGRLEEIAAKREEIGSLLRKGFPIIPIKPRDKAALVSYPQYAGKQQPTAALWDGWLERWPDCGIGIVTGGRYAALDFDSMDVSGYPGELFDTTLIYTARGYKTIYRSPWDIASATLALPGGPVEVFGAGKYAILPRSVHPSGFVYEYGQGWDVLAPFPEEIGERLRVRDKGKQTPDSPDLVRIVHYAARIQADCVRQILGHYANAGGHERENILFTLAVLLKQNGMIQSKAEEWIMCYYWHGMDRAGIGERTVRSTVRSAYTRHGTGYRMKCREITTRLPWIDCGGCAYLNRRVKKTMADETRFLWEVGKRCKGDAQAQTIALHLVLSGDLEERQLSNRQLADMTGIDAHTVANRIKRLENEGLLSTGDAPSKLLNF